MYGCCGSSNTCWAGPSSTTLPAYITPTRSHIVRITPRLWAISRIAASVSDRRARTRSSTSASTVASRPVVGSSSTSSFGSHASAMAITTRCCIPPESWCGYRCMTRTGSAMRTRRNASSACCFASSFDCPNSVKHSTICGSMRNTGFNAAPGSWYTIDASRARYRRSAASSIDGHVGATDQHVPAGDPAVRRQVSQRGVGGGRLAAPRLADEPVRLARRDLERHTAEHLARDAPHEVRDLEIVDLQGRGAGRGDRVAHDAYTVSRESAIRLMAITRLAMARAGKMAGHHVPPWMSGRSG